MVSASLLVARAGVWLLLMTVSSSTVPRRQMTSSGWSPGQQRAATDGCLPPLRRVEMLDVNLGTTSYRLREIHVRHGVKVGGPYTL